MITVDGVEMDDGVDEGPDNCPACGQPCERWDVYGEPCDEPTAAGVSDA